MDAIILKRFLSDIEVLHSKRVRQGSLNEEDYPDIKVSESEKCVNETTNSWLKCSDRIRSACIEFTDNTRKICNLISQLDTLCTDQSSFSFIVSQAKDLLGTIERDAKFTQKELDNLNEKLMKNCPANEKQVVVKNEVCRPRLSNIKRSTEEFTDDGWSIECDLLNSQQLNEDNIQEIIKEKEGCGIHSDGADSLLTVKEELPDNESIFSQSTGLLGDDENEELLERHQELEELLESDKNTICLSPTSLDSNNVSIDFARMDVQQINEKEIDTMNVMKTNSIENGKRDVETANKSVSYSNSSDSTIINPLITHEDNFRSHDSKSSRIENNNIPDDLREEIKKLARDSEIGLIKNNNIPDDLREEIKKLARDAENADYNSNCECIEKLDFSKNTRKVLSKNEKVEQMKILKGIYTISDIESTYDKSDIEYSESEEEYERKPTKLKPVDTTKSKDNDLIVRPCFVKLTKKERELCDNFINLNKRRHSTSSESSEILLKPLRKKTFIFSTDDSSSTCSNNEENNIESDEEHNSFSLSLPSPGNLKAKTDEEEENIDELAILNAIIDSDSFSSDDESTDNENSSLKQKKKFKSKYNQQNINGASEWKKDSLLTSNLNEPSEKLSSTEASNHEDSANEEKTVQIKDDNTTDGEDIFEILTDSSSSEIEFIDLIGKLRKAETGKTPGRKNIRALLSEDTLEQTTKQAEQAEKEHVERLKEKRKNMGKILSELEGTGLVLDASGTTRIEVNPLLSKRLKPHQKSGVQFMWDACYETIEMIQKYPGAGCILAHCMGLGKTFQVVTLVHTLFKYSIATKTKYVLVVCPLSTVYNWKNEFTIALNISAEDTIRHIHIISDEQKTKAAKYLVVQEWHKTGGVLIMCYEAFVRFSLSNEKSVSAENNLKALVNPGPDLIICDEGHQLKNAKALRSKTLMKTKTSRRIILTGTPLQNNLNEYYHMVQFVKPNLLGTYKEYINRFVNPIVNGQYDDSTHSDIKLMKMRSYVLHYLLKNTIQRYEVTELQKYLPPKLDYVLFIKLHPVQVKLYRKYMDTIKANATLGKMFSHFASLRPTWVHPYILHLKDLSKPSIKMKPPSDNTTIDGIIHLDEEVEVPNNEVPIGWWKEFTPQDFLTNLDYGPKFKIMISIIKECEKMNDQLLIFTQFLLDLDVIEKFLKLTNPSWKHGVNYLRMDGKLGMETRHKFCNKFNEPGSPIKIFLLTHKVGGLGLNFASANRVILMDVCWNPSYDTQSIFRVYRFGQIKPCYIYRLVSMGTMEEVAYERCVTKLAISGRVVDEKQISRHYKSIDLMSLYRCNVDITEKRPTPKLPNDEVLARLLQIHEAEIYKYHEHQSLLENRLDEVLDENEIKLAWEQFNAENEPVKQPPLGLQNTPMVLNPLQNLNNRALIANAAALYLNLKTNQSTNPPVSHSVSSREPSIYPSTSNAHGSDLSRNQSTNPRGSHSVASREPYVYPSTSNAHGADLSRNQSTNPPGSHSVASREPSIYPSTSNAHGSDLSRNQSTNPRGSHSVASREPYVYPSTSNAHGVDLSRNQSTNPPGSHSVTSREPPIYPSTSNAHGSDLSRNQSTNPRGSHSVASREPYVYPSTSNAHGADLSRNQSTNPSGSHSVASREPSIYPSTSHAYGTDPGSTRNTPQSGQYYPNPLNKTIQTNNKSTANVAVALPTKPGDMLKRFDLKFVQNPETGRDDIQLINTTKTFQNSTNKQHAETQRTSSNVGGNYPSSKSSQNSTHVGKDTTSDLTLQSIVNQYIHAALHNTTQGISVKNQEHNNVVPDGDTVPEKRGGVIQID